ncbi:hypothetical protein IAT38_005564 [Cryptococcus sp. DSM 104549]
MTDTSRSYQHFNDQPYTSGSGPPGPPGQTMMTGGCICGEDGCESERGVSVGKVSGLSAGKESEGVRVAGPSWGSVNFNSLTNPLPAINPLYLSTPHVFPPAPPPRPPVEIFRPSPGYHHLPMTFTIPVPAHLDPQIWAQHVHMSALALDAEGVPTREVTLTPTRALSGTAELAPGDTLTIHSLPLPLTPTDHPTPDTQLWPTQLFQGRYVVPYPLCLDTPAKRGRNPHGWEGWVEGRRREAEREGGGRWVRVDEGESGLVVFWREKPGGELPARGSGRGHGNRSKFGQGGRGWWKSQKGEASQAFVMPPPTDSAFFRMGDITAATHTTTTVEKPTLASRIGTTIPRPPLPLSNQLLGNSSDSPATQNGAPLAPVAPVETAPSTAAPTLGEGLAGRICPNPMEDPSSQSRSCQPSPPESTSAEAGSASALDAGAEELTQVRGEGFMADANVGLGEEGASGGQDEGGEEDMEIDPNSEEARAQSSSRTKTVLPMLLRSDRNTSSAATSTAGSQRPLSTHQETPNPPATHISTSRSSGSPRSIAPLPKRYFAAYAMDVDMQDGEGTLRKGAVVGGGGVVGGEDDEAGVVDGRQADLGDRASKDPPPADKPADQDASPPTQHSTPSNHTARGAHASPPLPKATPKTPTRSSATRSTVPTWHTRYTPSEPMRTPSSPTRAGDLASKTSSPSSPSPATHAPTQPPPTDLTLDARTEHLEKARQRVKHLKELRQRCREMEERLGEEMVRLEGEIGEMEGGEKGKGKGKEV